MWLIKTVLIESYLNDVFGTGCGTNAAAIAIFYCKDIHHFILPVNQGKYLLNMKISG